MTHPLDPHQTVANLEQRIERHIESALQAGRGLGVVDEDGALDQEGGATQPAAIPPGK